MTVLRYKVLGFLGFRFIIEDGNIKRKEWSAITTLQQQLLKVCRLIKKIV